MVSRTSKLHEVEATNLQFWFYGLFKLWPVKPWHKIKNNHKVSKDKEDLQSVDQIHSKKANKTTHIIKCVSYSQTCRQEYPSVIFHKTEEEIKYSFPCVSILWVSLSLWRVFLRLRWCFSLVAVGMNGRCFSYAGSWQAKLYIQQRQPWAFTNALCTSFPHPLTVLKKKK